MAEKWITATVSIVVAGGWSFSLIAGYVGHDYTPLTITTPVMMLLAGYAFGVRVIKKRNGVK